MKRESSVFVKLSIMFSYMLIFSAASDITIIMFHETTRNNTDHTKNNVNETFKLRLVSHRSSHLARYREIEQNLTRFLYV